MKTFTIKIKAQTDGDAEIAWEEIVRLIADGCTHGFNKNETSAFNFASDGEYDDAESWPSIPAVEG